ncbi:MAG: AAA family ATPase [Chloroflexota bacterium]|nr:AAA family ATPase [Chloroflexota bacterium]
MALQAAGAAAPAADDGGTAEARRAERRLVTILFADLVASTAGAEGRDPEETRDVLDRYYRLAREVIGRYGGTVEKFIGDAVMAVWGAPVAHEDAAERAVRAALELVDAVGRLPLPAGRAKLVLRAAAMTGEAAVTVGAQGEALVAGDLVNTAARLQSAAERATVLVDEATRRASGPGIVFERAAAIELRGKSVPVPAWRALRVVGVRRGELRADLEPPFVGRERELGLIKDLFHATSDERRLHCISITGQAGIGKSRLAWELEKYVDGLVEPVYWHQGRSPAYGEGITFWALGEMVRRRAGIAEDDDEATSRQKLGATLDEFVADPDERRWCEAKLLVLLAIGDAAQKSEGRELFAAWRLFFERLAERATTVLVFEDLHWADSGQIDFVEHMLEWSRQQRLLIITLARPELYERRPSWGAGRRNFTSIHLEPLPERAMRELLLGLVPGLPGGATRAIVRRAEGVPLYAVETVRMLLADGALRRAGERYEVTRPLESLAVPESLHALIAARLDALDSARRSLVQRASVVGQSFSLPALEAVAGVAPAELQELLDGLVRDELLRLESDPRSPERGQYQFVQGVMREVAYSTLPRGERKELHLAAARHYESLGDEELSSVLASHYLSAYQAAAPGAEAEALAAQARVALRAAADRATRLHSPEQALALLEQALLVSSDEEEQAALQARAANAATAAGRVERAVELYGQAIAWQRQQGNSAEAVRLAAQLGFVLTSNGRLEAAIDEMERVNAELASSADEPSLAALSAELGRAYFLRWDFARATPLVDRAIELAERHDLLPALVDALVTKGSLIAESRPREGRVVLTGAVALADTYELAQPALRGRNNLGILLDQDDPAGGLRVAEEALMLAERLGIRAAVMSFTNQVAWATAVWRGEFDEGLRILARFEEDELESLSLLHASWLRSLVAVFRGDRAEVERLRAVREAALATITNPAFHAGERFAHAWEAGMAGDWRTAYDETVATLEVTAEGQVRALPWAFLAAVQLRDLDRAKAVQARFLALPQRGRLLDARRREMEAGVLALEGRRDEAAAAYAAAIAGARELRATLDLAFIQLECAALLGTDSREGRAAADEARSFFERVGARVLIDLLDAAVAQPSVSTPQRLDSAAAAYSDSASSRA